MASVSSLGIGTGVDLQSMLTKIMDAERAPITAIGTKITATNNKISLYGTLKSKLDALKSAAETLEFPSRLSAMSAKSSDTATLEVSASFVAQTGSYNAVVSQLAKAQKSVTFAYDPTDTFGPGNLDFTVAGTDAASITIDAGMTLSQVATRVNDAKIGVTATVINTSDGKQRMVLTSDKSGSSNGFSLRPTSSAPSSSGTALTSFDPAKAVAPQNALLELDGLEVSSSTNAFTDAVTGLTFTAIKEGNASVTVKTDESKVVAAVQAFVDAYNAVTTHIKSNSAYNSTTKTAQAFNGDGTARSVQSALNDVRTTVPSALASANIKELSQLGISILQSGQLSLDTTKLTDAVKSSASDVLTAVSAYGKSFGESISSLLGTDGAVTSRVNSLNLTVSRYKDSQASLELRITLVEKRYRAQFTALDKLVSTMQTTSTYLAQQIATLPKS